MNIELAEAVASIRNELLRAAALGANTGQQFAVGPIELEFTVELKKAANGKFGFKAWVVSAEGGGGVTRGQTHKVKFTLTPQGPGGGDLLVAGTDDDEDGVGGLEGHIGR